jgi:hypothetical protein
MKYSLEIYGWTIDVSAHSLTDEQVSQIQEIMTENGYTELWEARYDIEEQLNIYSHTADMFQITKGLYDETINFRLIDEDGNVVTKFNLNDINDSYDVIDNIDDYDYVGYDIFPSKDSHKNILTFIDEHKGGVNTYYFESDETPKPEDFSCQSASIETPNNEWEYILRVFFKTNELREFDLMDNTNKSSTIELFNS